MEIHDGVFKKIVVVYKKCFMKHGGQPIKQVSKLEKIFECLASPKPITQKKLQHSGIGSHLFYLNLQHYNVSLSFNKVQLIIVKCSQIISLISSVQLKSSPYQFMRNMFLYKIFFDPRNSKSFKLFQQKIMFQSSFWIEFHFDFKNQKIFKRFAQRTILLQKKKFVFNMYIEWNPFFFMLNPLLGIKIQLLCKIMCKIYTCKMCCVLILGFV